MSFFPLLDIAQNLERAGLIWQPEIGDEVSAKETLTDVSILVDTHGLTPKQLRQRFLWLPTVEQLVWQFEARQAVLFHAGLELGEQTFCYKTVVQTSFGAIECQASSLRESMSLALHNLLIGGTDHQIH